MAKINRKLLKQTVIGMDFLSAMDLNQPQPSVNSFLDYRSSLNKKQANPFIKLEIKSVDEILNILTTK